MSDSSKKDALKYQALADAVLAAVGGAGIEKVAEKALDSAVAGLNLAAGALILWDDTGAIRVESVVADQDDNRRLLLDLEKNLLTVLRRDHKLNAAYMELGGKNPRSVFSLPIEASGRQLGALIGITVETIKLNDLADEETQKFLRSLAALLTLVPGNEEKEKAIRYEAIDELAVGVNHMINNPLTPLIGNLDLLNKEKENLPESVQRKLTVIEDSANQIREITARLMNAAEAPSIEYINGKKMIDLTAGGEKQDSSDDEEKEDND
ncbi:MAG: hypothetical protein GY841_19330 [FCB group bacterium]|nr:hypothetical protein [FCB group bacterium]